jgi:hypothetical protein
MCVGVPSLSPDPCTTSYLSCPPFLPARSTGHPSGRLLIFSPCSWGGGWQGGSLQGYLQAMAPAEHVPTPPPAASSRATGITARVQLWVVQPVQVHAELVAHPSGAVRSHGQLDGHLVSVRLQHTSLNDAPPATIHSSRGSCPTLEVVVDAVQVAPLTLTHPAR